MGREVKRVPLDFEWPLEELWKGYVNPYWKQHIKCASCGGSGCGPVARLYRDQWYGYAAFDPKAYGATPLTIDHPEVQAFARRNCERHPGYYGGGEAAVHREARRLFELWRNQWSHHLIQADVDALVANERLWDFTRTPRTEEQREIVRKKIESGGNCWLPESNGYTPTADEVNAWSLRGMGHDACNQWICVRARCEREGADVECVECGGKGHTWPEGVEALYDAWEEYDPPTGEGWQLWSTTSEGHPMSPVFSSADALCNWCVSTGASIFGYETADYDTWMRLCNGAPMIDMIADANGLRVGVVADVARESANKP